jgi:hypothetical protein
MNTMQSSFRINDQSKMSTNFALVIFILMLVVNGTYLRQSPRTAGEPAILDWLVMVQLSVSLLGFISGAYLVLRSRFSVGLGTILLALFCLATAFSSINSPYPLQVVGYSALLLGACMFTIGLVNSAKNIDDLERIEKIWFWIVGLCVIKDAVASLMFTESEVLGEAMRLGWGFIHPNRITPTAAIVFWLTFRHNKASIAIWLLRIAMVVVIIGAVSRMGILAFLTGGFFYFLFKQRGYFMKYLFLLTCFSAIILFILILSFSGRLEKGVVGYVTRGQTRSELSTFTARTDIWRQAIRQLPDSPLTGNGYNHTTITLKPITADFQAPHCHNEFLEALFSMGPLGFISLLLMYIYSLKWFISFSRLEGVFSSDIALHAVSMLTVLFVTALFEAWISIRLLPLHIIFFFYLLLLDREKQFAVIKEKK